LSACSTYFDTILSQYEEKDPIVIMRDVKFSDIKVLVEFMYKGEINIDHVSATGMILPRATDYRGISMISRSAIRERMRIPNSSCLVRGRDPR